MYTFLRDVAFTAILFAATFALFYGVCATQSQCTAFDPITWEAGR